jgi:putative membrane protein
MAVPSKERWRKIEMMMHEFYGWGYPMFGILFWIGIVVLIAFLVRAVGGTSQTTEGGSAQSHLETLKERYARGEIEQKEFEQRKRDLAK